MWINGVEAAFAVEITLTSLSFVSEKNVLMFNLTWDSVSAVNLVYNCESIL